MIVVERRNTRTLQERVEQIRQAQQPGSKVRVKMQHDIEQIVYQDNANMLLKSVDRDGKPLAPPAESTLKKKGRGPGPALVPRGRFSRFITNFVAAFTRDGSELVAGYEDILSKEGKPFVQYHLQGATKPGTRWVLPRRNVGGISRGIGWSKVRARFARFVADVAAGS